MTTALIRFSRPHTIVGTVLAVLTLWAMAATGSATAGLAETVPSSLVDAVPALLLALVASLATNVFIVGLNQLTDVDIDRINKPWLPLAAGTMSMEQGRAVVAASGAAAVVLAAAAGPFMLAAVVVGLLVGSAYSLPPLRLKRSHVAAAAAITSVRALVVNLLLFAHFTDVLAGGPTVPRHVLALTGMVLGLTIAISWFKDIPDAAGDAEHGIATLVLRLGAPRVMALGALVLGACYVSLIVGGIVGLPGVNGAVLAVGHAVLLVVMVALVRRADIEDTASLTRFYQGIWRLFFAEYAVFALAALV